MTTWTIIVIMLSFLLLAFMCWKEWQRSSKSRLALRLLASLLAVACFACITLPLTTKVTVANEQGKQAVLLTEGFNKDSLNSFLHNGNVPVYAIDNSLASASKNFNVQFISLAYWHSLKQQVSTIHIFGFGLNKDELEQLPASSIVFHPLKLSGGTAYVNWQRKINAGDRLRIQGNFLNTSSSEVKLILAGYEVSLDTITIAANKSENFELSATPKQLGRAVYSLLALSGKDTLQNEPIPFEIEQPGNLKVLILAAAPDFENKFLKSWLSQNNYEIVTRTAISKSKSEKTFLNTSQISFSTITPALLSNFDVLIADVSELTAISKSELAVIESQVAQKGLGMIVKVDSAAVGNSFYSKPFPVVQNTDSSQRTLSLYMPVSNQYASIVSTDHPLYIRPQPGTQSLIEDKQSNIVANSSIYGAGKIIYTTLNNTFTWMLSGDNNTYPAFWSFLLKKATAKSDVEKSWSLSPAFPRVNSSVDINYSSDVPEAPRVQVGENAVHFIQNPDLPFQWQGSYWPQKAGWQPILQENSNTFWWYAYHVGDWKTITDLQKIKATRQYISSVTEDVAKNSKEDTVVEVPVSKKYFFIVFLICAGFLWLEKKL